MRDSKGISLVKIVVIVVAVIAILSVFFFVTRKENNKENIVNTAETFKQQDKQNININENGVVEPKDISNDNPTTTISTPSEETDVVQSSKPTQ